MTGCPKGYFGLDCLQKCSTYCSGNESCNRFTGVCDEGCKDGWSGPICGTSKHTRMLCNNTECNITINCNKILLEHFASNQRKMQ